MVSIAVVVLLSFSPLAFCAVDLTKIDDANGRSVVESVVNLIGKSCIFNDDNLFLRRLAYVETHDGMNANTYRPGYNGGIWQIDLDMFQSTKSSSKFQKEYQEIKDHFGIDWNNVTWSDLRKPLYSALAASLFTSTTIDAGGIPKTTNSQAQFWAAKFQHGGTAANFTQLSNELQVCRGHEEQDLVFLLDESSSLTATDFLRTKFFVENLIQIFQIGPNKTRVALIMFSTHATLQFGLETYSSLNGVKQGLAATKFSGGGTNIAAAIDMGVDVLFNSTVVRASAAKIIFLVTDGQSRDKANTKLAAERARINGAITFVIGVGKSVDHKELTDIASDPYCLHLFSVRDYNKILDIRSQVARSTCSAPLVTNSTVTCDINTCPVLAFYIPQGGVTIYSTTTCSKAVVYAAFHITVPNDAYSEYSGEFYDFMGTDFNIPGGSTHPLYVSIDSPDNLQQNCTVSVKPIPGNVIIDIVG